MRRRTTLLLAAAVSVLVCGGLGWLLAGTWQQGLVETLEELGLTVAIGAPGEALGIRTATAACLALAGPLAVLCQGLLDRLRRAEPPAWRLVTDVALLLLGGNLGLGGATIATARVAVPQALEASVDTGAMVVQLRDLGLPNWALAGVVGAAILLTAVEAGRLLLADGEED
jgi:hypothetical protein